MTPSTLPLPQREESQRRKQAFRIGTAVAILMLALFIRLVANQYEVLTSTPPPPPAPIEATSAEAAERYRARLRVNPDDVDAYAMLGHALLQQVRERGDASLYLPAESALDAALALDPEHGLALIGQGILSLARHEFEDALVWGGAARGVNPYSAAALGVLVDAQVEMGRYEEALETAQAMMDLRPGVASYTRASYLRELHGNSAAAIEAMTTAAEIASPGTESALWSLAQLGNLYLRSGRLSEAQRTYQAALAQRSDYPFALAGSAAVAAAQGDPERAIRIYEDLVESQPMPEFIIPLMELYVAMGRSDEAEAQRGLLAVIHRLSLDAGMDMDLEMALFDADWGDDPERAVAQARAAYEKRPSIYAADALAWALHRAGHSDEALPIAEESLRLGTQDAMLYFHAGTIAAEVGDEERAQVYLQKALAVNPVFSPLHAPSARAMLNQLKEK